jgi:hypothetical protein
VDVHAESTHAWHNLLGLESSRKFHGLRHILRCNLKIAVKSDGIYIYIYIIYSRNTRSSAVYYVSSYCILYICVLIPHTTIYVFSLEKAEIVEDRK